MAQERSNGPTNDAAGQAAPKPRRKVRRGPTAFQRLRAAVTHRGSGLTLNAEEAADLYWRAGCARFALEDDNEKRPSKAYIDPQDPYDLRPKNVSPDDVL